MNLIIDAGNTVVKVAFFKADNCHLVERVATEQFQESLQGLLLEQAPIDKAIVSVVGSLGEGQLQFLQQLFPVHVLGPASQLPFINGYATPQTLGVDRMALAAAAWKHNPNGNTLVIDAGSCITYEMVTSEGVYLGGAISPGVMMRYRAMHQQTAKLPLLQPGQLEDFIGNSTESCMHSGVLNGISCEIDGVISQYRDRFQDLTVILTGGDLQILSKRLKNTIFAHSDFVLKGLNYLLEYNIH